MDAVLKDELKERNEIPTAFKWNLEAMYESDAAWEGDFSKLQPLVEKMKNYKGRLTTGAADLLDALELDDEIGLLAENLFVYARMRRDEDNRNTTYQAMTDRCIGMLSELSASLSFIAPELMLLTEEQIDTYITECPALATYEFSLKNSLRRKAHILSEGEERIMGLMSAVTHASSDTFTLFNNADIKFREIEDENGNMTELTHGNYSTFMESTSRDVRKNAFKAMYEPYISNINTIAAMFSYDTKTDAVLSKIRNYPSSIEASLFADNVPLSVYDNLISTVHDNLHNLHRYVKLRKKILNLDEMNMYDIYVPLAEKKEKYISYDEAVEMMCEALSVMGDEYIANVRKAVSERWIDVYENKGKTSGAYSFGTYSSYPYILLNYKGLLKDVFTLVHEMGHSMHSYYTRASQPYVYGGHSIFTAEVASTVNENLLAKYLLKNADSDMRKELLNHYLDGFKGTLFRQTMFAEFERWTHEEVDAGGVLTAESMCGYYKNLNEKYYGSAIVSDPEIAYEWARIPHFYNAFYVYKYATGYSAAAAIAGNILGSDGENAVRKYMGFLKSGDSNHPIELLKIAGPDMSSKEPIEQAMVLFTDLLDEFESLI